MTRYVFKMPDLGEGTVEAELVAWHVKVGDLVTEDQIMAEVMTDKAAVEVPAPVSGRVISLTGAPGDMVPVGGELVVFETGGEDEVEVTAQPAASDAAVASAEARAGKTATTVTPAPAGKPTTAVASAAESVPARASKPAGRTAPATHSAVAPAQAATSPPPVTATSPRPAPDLRAVASSSSSGARAASHDRPARVMASPASRRRAREAGVDLKLVQGSGPGGRITRQDLDAALAAGASAARTAGSAGEQGTRKAPSGLARRSGTDEIKIIGVRRVIANRMTEAKRNIPHFAYVEEVDVTELESLRQHLNGKLRPGAAQLTYLPFLITALARVLEDYPQCNAWYDSERNVVVRHRALHAGVATQTPDGLKVPVVRHAESLTLWELAEEIRRLSEAARTGKATKEELSGSTITVTSLGKLGGIVSTPIINAPEMGIIGVNKAVERPVVVNGAIAVRRIMNLSSSFDHRFVDGYDAAAMIQALKERLEHPATIFITG
jgi:2-oxoisovalerate dehydrogenase E2 component (dihydrolipoyl transacylase)